MSEKALSLCIPTNGIIDWVVPVLDNIYKQNVPEDRYEVVVTDNGVDDNFLEIMLQYKREHENLVYKRTDAVQYNNIIECFMAASGELLKFVNHRSILEEGTIEYLLNFVEKYKEKHPWMYFLDGAEKNRKKEIEEYTSFDEFLGAISYWSSWTTGYAFWKDDLDWLKNKPVLNYFAPNMDLLFHDRKRALYIVDNKKIMHDLPTDETKKGVYNLYKYWALEYPTIVLQLLVSGDISPETFMTVKNDLEAFNTKMYTYHNILKIPSSYDASHFDEYADVFFVGKKIKKRAYMKAVLYRGRDIIKKILHIKSFHRR